MITVAELCAWGLPSILVPLPTAAADHQTRNARVLSGAGAALLLPEPELSAERLAAEVQGLLSDGERRRGMADAARRRGRPHAVRGPRAGVRRRYRRTLRRHRRLVEQRRHEPGCRSGRVHPGSPRDQPAAVLHDL
jgi:hypothetical protein